MLADAGNRARASSTVFCPVNTTTLAGRLHCAPKRRPLLVEVYFPETESWVTFDPTPPAGRAPHAHTGLAAQLSKYTEALELMWFQYVVGYDKQEQRSPRHLAAQSLV